MAPQTHVVESNLRRWSKGSLWAFLLITIVCVFGPFYPTMPAGGLDSSWYFGVNQAVAQGLAFGRDIIANLGPYGSILTEQYHPATDSLMLAGAVYLGISYWIAVVLSSRNKWYLILALSVVLAGLASIRDILFLSYPLLAGLFCFKIISQSDIDCRNKKLVALTAIIFFPMGLLVIIKGSFLILCVSIVVLATALFLSTKRWYLAITAVASSILSVLFFWIAAGQSILNLPDYFISMNEFVSGYTEAMATSGSGWEIFVYLIAAFSLLTAAALEKAPNAQSKLFLLSVIFVFLFVAFKHGFVRVDHAVMAGTTLLIGALLLSLNLRSMGILIALCVSSAAGIYIDRHHFSVGSIYRNIQSTYYYAFAGLRDRVTHSNWSQESWNNAVARLKDEAKFPVLPGTTDIYSFNQSYLIASGNLWNPRPMFQSVTSFTSKLAEKNKDHLLGDRAPDNVIFRVEPIDGRLPSLEDGKSWPVLLTHYRPTALENDFLYLRRLHLTSGQSELQPVAGDSIHKFGDIVPVPDAASPIFAHLAIRPSILGRLADIFFKPTELQISLNLEDGAIETYRIIAEMARSEFMISPLVADTHDFAFLYGRRAYLDGNTVKSFVIMPVGATHFWDSKFKVTFKTINLPPSVDIPNLYKFDPIEDDNSTRPVSIAERCDGFVDKINGASPQSSATVSGHLKVEGWLAKSVEQGAPAQSVFVVLTDSNGRNTFINTRQMARGDVAAAFGRPALAASGYTSVADVSTLDGQYTLGVAFAEGDRIERCRQFKIPLTFKKARS